MFSEPWFNKVTDGYWLLVVSVVFSLFTLSARSSTTRRPSLRGSVETFSGPFGMMQTDLQKWSEMFVRFCIHVMGIVMVSFFPSFCHLRRLAKAKKFGVWSTQIDHQLRLSWTASLAVSLWSWSWTLGYFHWLIVIQSLVHVSSGQTFVWTLEIWVLTLSSSTAAG